MPVAFQSWSLKYYTSIQQTICMISDFHEGIIPMVLSLSISQWLKEKYFAPSGLNYDIKKCCVIKTCTTLR